MKFKDFNHLMIARFLVTLGLQMQSVILGWQMYSLTRDPLCLGFVGLTEAIPALSLALFSGYLVDRSRPLIIYRWVILGCLISAGIMLVSQSPRLQISVPWQTGFLYLSSFISGTVRSFTQPVIFSTVPRLVPREKLPQATAWMSTAMQIARVSGPGLGGLLFGWYGIEFSSTMVCFSLLLAFLSILLIQTSIHPLPHSKQKTSFKEELLSGVHFVRKHPVLFPALTLDMISVLFGGVSAVLPIFAAEVLTIGPKGLGLLRAGPALGATLCSLLLTRIPLRQNAGKWLLQAVTGFGLCILAFSFCSSFLPALFFLTLSGAFDSVSMVIRSSAVQLSSPDSMRGRISAVNSIFIGSSNEIGEFESGVAAKLMGLLPSIIFGGTMCLLTVGAIAWTYPRLRRLNLDDLSAEII